MKKKRDKKIENRKDFIKIQIKNYKKKEGKNIFKGTLMMKI
jgi:hypothetical protein